MTRAPVILRRRSAPKDPRALATTFQARGQCPTVSCPKSQVTPMSKPSRVAVIACAIALVAIFARGDEWAPTRAFRTFSKSSWRGLPQSSVMALAQSSDGVLWIGTLDGVATFDGKSIEPVASVPGAPVRGLITTIITRAKGGVYVASQSGVHLFDGASWRLIATKRGAGSLAESRDGVLWMVDGGGALWILDHEKWKPQQTTTPVVSVAAARDGSIWIATNDGAARIVDKRIEPVSGTLPSRPGALLAASDGRIWVATQNCTIHWTRGGNDGWHQVAFAPWPRGAFRALAKDRRGRIWAGSFGGHVAFGSATTPWTVWGVAQGQFDAGVMSVFRGGEGHIWFGLNAVGLVQWVGESWSHRPMIDPQNPTYERFSTFGLSRMISQRGILAAVFNSGILELTDGPVRRFGPADGITEDVRTVVEAEPKTIYAGTRFGIFESHDGKPFTQTLKIGNGLIMGFFKSPDGRWYAASSTEGVFVRDGETWHHDDAINAHLDNMHVRAMLWRRNGELWIATLRGISVFRDAKFVERFNSASQHAVPDSVNALLEVSDNEVWAGGTGGIAILRDNIWHRMTQASDGLPGETIYSLARANDGTIWAGGAAGVGRFANGHWTIWDSRSGLLQEECNLNGLLVD